MMRTIHTLASGLVQHRTFSVRLSRHQALAVSQSDDHKLEHTTAKYQHKQIHVHLAQLPVDSGSTRTALLTAIGDKSLQAIECTGTDNQTTNRKYTKHKMTHPNTNRLTLVKAQNLILKQFTRKNCSYQCAYDCTQLCYTIQHRTVLIIFTNIMQTIMIAQTLSNGGDGVIMYDSK